MKNINIINNKVHIIMIMLNAINFAFMCSCSPQVMAMSIPQKSPYDPHIQRVSYRAGDVVKLDAVVGRVTVIVFAADEVPLDLPSGYSTAWEFRKTTNMISIKPKALNADTNLIVKTDKRLYTFDLTLKPFNDNTGVYLLTFDYPEDIAEQKIIRTSAQLNDFLFSKPPKLNRNYSMEIGDNSQEISPTEAYDDGRFTYFRFPGNREVPAVFAVSADGKEYDVSTHMDKERLVIHQLAGSFILRSGNQIVGIFNEAYDAMGVAPENGTTVANLKRSIREQSGEQNAR